MMCGMKKSIESNSLLKECIEHIKKGDEILDRLEVLMKKLEQEIKK